MKKIIVCLVYVALFVSINVSASEIIKAQEVENKNLEDVVTDASLKEYLNVSKFHRDYDTPISAADMESLSGFLSVSSNTNTVNTAKIKSLEGIQYATNITGLQCAIQALTYVPPLEDLTKLQKITLKNNNLTNIDFLENSSVEILDISANKISSLAPLSTLSNITELNIGDNTSLTDFTPIANLTTLEVLKIGSNSTYDITDISFVENLENLTELKIYSHSLEDISPIQSLTSLEVLNLNGNNGSEISDLSALQNLENLRSVDLNFRSKVYDISPLQTVSTIMVRDQRPVLPPTAIGYGMDATIENPVKDKYGNTIALTDISSGAVYNNETNTISLEGITKNTTITAEFEDPTNSNYYGTISFPIIVDNPPVFSAMDDLIIKQGFGDEIDLLADVVVTDVEDGDLTSKVEVDDQDVDYEETGVYEIEYQVEDSIGNSVIATRTVKVVSYITGNSVGIADEETILLEEQLIDLFKVVNSDAELISVDQSQVDYSKPGVYEVVFTDESANEIIGSLQIRDLMPSLEVSSDLITLGVGETIDDILNQLSYSATEITSGDLTAFIDINDSEIDYATIGNYPLIFSVSDEEGNVVTKSVQVYISEEDSVEPIDPNEPSNPIDESDEADNQVSNDKVNNIDQSDQPVVTNEKTKTIVPMSLLSTGNNRILTITSFIMIAIIALGFKVIRK